jgi:hypothetical protein
MPPKTLKNDKDKDLGPKRIAVDIKICMFSKCALLVDAPWPFLVCWLSGTKAVNLSSGEGCREKSNRMCL